MRKGPKLLNFHPKRLYWLLCEFLGCSDAPQGGGSLTGMVVVMMGPCGCGKTTVGRLVAERLGAVFIEGDDFHPAENRSKMAAGQPLDDSDRWPWLEAIAAGCADRLSADESVVVACSALKRVYREKLKISGARTAFVLLDGSKEVIGVGATASRSAQARHPNPAALTTPRPVMSTSSGPASSNGSVSR